MDDPPGERPGRHARPDLLTPAELAGLGGLELVARRVVEGFLMGLHRSPHRGFSAEFAEHRAYQPGDDLRYVDWRIWGRSDRFYVKQFEEETNLRAHLVLDVSASMDWRSREDGLPTKLLFAKQLAACLAWILLRQGDAVGVVAFDERIRAGIRPRGGRKHWRHVCGTLQDLPPGGTTAAHTALRDVAVRIAKRSLVILISDLLVEADETLTALRFLRHHGHEILVFHILDPGERELPQRGDARLYDPEGGGDLPVSIADVRGEYRDAVHEAIGEWYQALGRSGIDYAAVGTDEPFTLALRSYLHKREHLG